MITSAGQRNASLYVDNVHPDWPGHTAIPQRGITDGLHDEWSQSRLTSKTNGVSPNIGDAFNLIAKAYGLFDVDTDSNDLAGWALGGWYQPHLLPG
jgi:hypothetical protein